MTADYPLGRNSMSFRDKMARYHGEIERLVYAAEQLCPVYDKEAGQCNNQENCSFKRKENGFFWCGLYDHRQSLGDHILQHDIPPAPSRCACGGECTGHREIGVCPEGAPVGNKILCKSLTACPHQKIVDHQAMAFCERESAALKMAEEPVELKPTMPENLRERLTRSIDKDNPSEWEKGYLAFIERIFKDENCDKPQNK